MLIRVELNLSHWPLVCRWYGLVHIFCIPISLQRSATNWLSKFWPWSIRIFSRNPYGFGSHLCSLGPGYICLGIPGEMVCDHQNILIQALPRFQAQIVKVNQLHRMCGHDVFEGGLWLPGFEGKTLVTLPEVLLSLGSHARPEEPIMHEVKHILQAQITNLIIASSESNLPLCSWQNQLKEGLLWFSGLGYSV